MELEKQVCSLELSKKLKELGVKQDSLYFWWEDTYGVNKERRLHNYRPRNRKNGWSVYSAFTVAELGEMLPSGIEDNALIFYKSKDPKDKVFYADIPETEVGLWEATEADARAKMLIWLIENGYIKGVV